MNYLEMTALIMLGAIASSAPVAPRYAGAQSNLAALNDVLSPPSHQLAHAPVPDRHLHARPHHINQPVHG